MPDDGRSSSSRAPCNSSARGLSFSPAPRTWVVDWHVLRIRRDGQPPAQHRPTPSLRSRRAAATARDKSGRLVRCQALLGSPSRSRLCCPQPSETRRGTRPSAASPRPRSHHACMLVELAAAASANRSRSAFTSACIARMLQRGRHFNPRRRAGVQRPPIYRQSVRILCVDFLRNSVSVTGTRRPDGRLAGAHRLQHRLPARPHSLAPGRHVIVRVDRGDGPAPALCQRPRVGLLANDAERLSFAVAADPDVGCCSHARSMGRRRAAWYISYFSMCRV